MYLFVSSPCLQERQTDYSGIFWPSCNHIPGGRVPERQGNHQGINEGQHESLANSDLHTSELPWWGVSVSSPTPLQTIFLKVHRGTRLMGKCAIVSSQWNLIIFKRFPPIKMGVKKKSMHRFLCLAWKRIFCYRVILSSCNLPIMFDCSASFLSQY